jgi:small-conductance mechanosensitive channel
VLYVDSKLAEEGATMARQIADMEDEAPALGATRLGTLLPLLRNVLISAIFAIAGMIVLSSLGVDIAPLFAGAGGIGLAVGFGAQTLIRDIFSGGFFLFDDAFRKGEYIELGNIRGTVEKISLRSFQLRHHNGPLHTVPFGEIAQLTNYSRDWVIMKLPLRLTYDTDVDRVRKLVKKLGVELLKHPDVGSHFLQPLKSQGVVEMDDSAMIIRVKFMTKPGDQWQTRKVVYSAIQEMFQREGIRFANREVTVRIEGKGASTADDDVLEQAASAAARRVLDDVQAKKAKPVLDDR